MAFSVRQSIELFHLSFVRALFAKGEDKGRIAIKGGCNLRFYFQSPRYSEDIDFDVARLPKETLRNKVERLLQSPLVATPLRVRGIELTDITAPKQTDTTQRWKVGLVVRDVSVPLRTKLEFSRRDAIAGTEYESVDADLARSYGLTATLATHYGAQAAIAQKIQALAGRAEPQARDLFDLSLLLSRPDAAAIVLGGAQKRGLTDAIERAMAISFAEHTSKVVAYLDPEQAKLHAGRPTFEALQELVVSRLEALR
jgi:predicted nucleotidyltransferase component of viral defense system